MIEGRQARFDLALGRARKSAVMLEFEMRAKVWLDKADAAAQKIARSRGEDGTVTMDDVKAEIGEPVGVHPHAAGALFNRKHWERAGFAQSKRPASHASVVFTWRLRRTE